MNEFIQVNIIQFWKLFAFLFLSYFYRILFVYEIVSFIMSAQPSSNSPKSQPSKKRKSPSPKQTKQSKQDTKLVNTTKRTKPIKRIKKEPKLLVGMVIDRSGSMMSMGSEVQNGFNMFVQNLAKTEQSTQVTVVRFDSEVEVVHEAQNVTKIPKATAETFRPRGSTALFDAVVSTMVRIKAQSKQFPDAKVMIAILTDGEENASQKMTSGDRFKKTIRYYTNKHKWDFKYLAANQDAISSGRSLGFMGSNCLSYSADSAGCQMAMSSLSQSVSRLIQGKKGGFTQAERQASVRSLP